MPATRERAMAALTSPWPLLVELAIGAMILAVVAAIYRRPEIRLVLTPAALAIAVVPLLWFGPLPNPTRPLSEFSYAASPFIVAVKAESPHRFLTLDPPRWYTGLPDQLAAAGVPTLRMFSSLNLDGTERLVRAIDDDDAGDIRRAVGIDVVASIGETCPGTPAGTVDDEQAWICLDEAALRPPYWLPPDLVVLDDVAGSPIRPREASLDASALPPVAIAIPGVAEDGLARTMTVDAPADGWVWLDRAWYPTWRLSVDGTPIEALRALGGQLIPVSAGQHEIRQDFVPWDALLGLAIGLIAIVVALLWVWGGRSAARPDAG